MNEDCEHEIEEYDSSDNKIYCSECGAELHDEFLNKGE